MVALGSARHMEVYGGESDGRCGIALVTDDYTEFLNYNEWNDGRFNEDELRDIKDAIRSSTAWKHPTSRLPERYNEYIRDFNYFPQDLDDAQTLDYARERMGTILGDLGKRLVASLSKNIVLKNETDYEILAIIIVSSYFRDQFSFLPLVCVYGAPNCGKSTVLEAVAQFMYHGIYMHGTTGAALNISVDKCDASMCIDETLLYLNRDKDQGSRIMEFLLGACYANRCSFRMDYERRDLTVYNIYTNCVFSVKGNAMPDDLRSRSVMIEMPLTKKGQRTYSVAQRRFIEYPPGVTPEEIIDCLYALKLINLQSKDTKNGKSEMCGIWFDSFDRKVHRMLTVETSKGNGEYLYSKTYNVESIEINNRDQDMAQTLLTIGDSMGFGHDVILKITENARESIKQRSATTEGRLFESYLEEILSQYDESHPSILGNQSNPTMKDVIEISRRISISSLYSRYWNLVDEEGTGGGGLSKKALFSHFGNLGFTHTKAGMHNAWRVDSDDSRFAEQFARCLEIYADEETRQRFSDVLIEFGRLE